MFLYHILKNFAPGTRMRYYINDRRIEDIGTVADAMHNGLMMSLVVNPGELTVADGAIVYSVKTY